jgi:hypothetical protein
MLHIFITIRTQPKPLLHHLYCFLSVDKWLAAAGTKRAISWAEAAIKYQNMYETTLYHSTYVVQFVGFLRLKKLPVIMELIFLTGNIPME